MKKLIVYIIVLIMVILTPVVAFCGHRVVDSLHNVDLISTDKMNEEGEKYGVDYYVHNHNMYPVYVSIQATVTNNVYDSLVPGQFIVDRDEKAHMGWVIQTDETVDSLWEVEWEVQIE